MSQAIHQAQAVQSILGDESLSIAERILKALQAYGEIDFAKLDEALADELQSDAEQINAAIEESVESIERSEVILDEWRAELEHLRSVLEKSPELLPQSDVMHCQERLARCEMLRDSVASHRPRLLEVLDCSASRIVEEELDRIIAELDVKFHVLPEGAICEAREHRDLIVPRLIKVLEEAIALARADDMPDGLAHFFAVFLLTEFKAAEALPVMLEGFSLAGELPFDLFGDAVHEVLKRMLALFLGDRPAAIEALVDDRSLNMYVRWQAAISFLYLVGEGHIDRDEAVRRLQRSLRRAIDGNDDEMAGPLICELVDYAPRQALSDIREAFERGLVDEVLVDLSSVEQAIAEGQDRLQQELHWRGPVAIDTLEELKTWAAFRPERRARRTDPLSPILPLGAILPTPRFEADDEPSSEKPGPIVADGPRVGRNDPCPCGSGKKFKKCCGARG